MTAEIDIVCPTICDSNSDARLPIRQNATIQRQNDKHKRVKWLDQHCPPNFSMRGKLTKS